MQVRAQLSTDLASRRVLVCPPKETWHNKIITVIELVRVVRPPVDIRLFGFIGLAPPLRGTEQGESAYSH